MLTRVNDDHGKGAIFNHEGSQLLDSRDLVVAVEAPAHNKILQHILGCGQK
jgi:hypothetical protein